MTTKLKTETNTVAMERRVMSAARAIQWKLKRPKLSIDFEHGQWWVTDLKTGAQWSVVDAEGGNSVDGFDFEQVTDGDEQ